MGVMIALVFFIYVAGATEPITTTHRITARGIETFDRLYEWFLMDNFYFTKKNNQLKDFHFKSNQNFNASTTLLDYLLLE